MLLSRTRLRVDAFTDMRLRRRVRGRDLVLPADYHWMPRLPRWGKRPIKAIAAAQSALNVVLAVGCGLWAAVVARRRSAEWVLAVVDEGFSVIAGYACARVTGLPLVIWVFDPWEENAYNDCERWLARKLEPRIWPRAKAILVHAEEMSEHYRAKHGVRCEVLPTPVDLDAVAAPAQVGGNRDGINEVLVGGAVYWLQADAVRRLGRVCRRMPDVELTLVSSPELLPASGIAADRVEPLLPRDLVRARLRRADVLFLGLSFDSDAPLVVNTSAPARLPEYLASGTPLLVHAPSGSHVAEYAKRAGFATVVDEPDEDRLAAALREILADPVATEDRARRGSALAEQRHSADRVADALERALEGARRP
jgi:glycosyltransferase involved in cell wall biosynthesis